MKKIVLKYLVFSFCIITFVSSLHSQVSSYNDSWRWILFTTETGLPSNRVFDIIETPDGTTWASTEFGLAWYDGYLWHAISDELGNTTVKTTSFGSDSRGTLYAEFAENLYIGGKEGFHRQPVYFHGKKISVTNPVYLEGEGILFINNSQLLSLHDSIAKPFHLQAELKNEVVLNLFKGRSNHLWIITNRGMYSYYEHQLRKRFPFLADAFRIVSIVENKYGSGLAFVMNPNNAQGIWEWQSTSEPRFVQNVDLALVESFDIQDNDNVILAKSQGTIMERVRNQWSPLAPHPDQMNNIVSLRYRSNGDLWMGTEQGLYLFKASSNRWQFIRHSSPSTWNNVNQIMVSKNGSLWAATEEGVFIQFPNGSQQFIDHIGSYKLKVLTGIAEDAKGNIWISSGSSFEGAFRWDGQEWKHIGYKQGLDAGYVHRMRKDRFGRLWFFGLERPDAIKRNVEVGPGAYVLSEEHFTQWSVQQGLPCGRVYAVDAASDGTLWFGTLCGLSSWKPDGGNSMKGTWQHWTTNQGLRLDRIYDVIVDRNDRVWFCDQTSGLGYFENNQPQYYTTSNGLVSNAVWEIEEDSSGKLWMSTRSGISLFDGEAWYTIDASDGLTNTRLWSILPRNDFVYVATYGDGIAILNKKEQSLRSPQILISQPLFRENITQIQWNVCAFWGEIQNNRIETRYRLDEEKWSQWNTIRTVSFFDLSAGKHSLEIQTKKILGESPSLKESVLIEVPEPYYLHPFFYVPISFLVLVVLAMRTRYIIQKTQQEKALRLSEERYRTLAETAQDAIYIIDQNHLLQYVNSYALHHIGLLPGDVIGKPWEDVMLFQQREELRKKFISVLREGMTEHHEHSILFPTATKWYSAILTPLCNEQGKIIALIGISRDITNRKQTEEETQRLVAELQSALSQIKTLKGLLPICSHCKKIRDDQGYWFQLEKYIVQHSDATFTHGICPDCIKQHFPEVKLSNKNPDNPSSEIISS